MLGTLETALSKSLSPGKACGQICPSRVLKGPKSAGLNRVKDFFEKHSKATNLNFNVKNIRTIYLFSRPLSFRGRAGHFQGVSPELRHWRWCWENLGSSLYGRWVLRIPLRHRQRREAQFSGSATQLRRRAEHISDRRQVPRHKLGELMKNAASGIVAKEGLRHLRHESKHQIGALASGGKSCKIPTQSIMSLHLN